MNTVSRGEILIYMHILSRFGPHGNPALKLERVITNPQVIDSIVKNTLYGKGYPAKIILKKDKLRAASELVQLGFISTETYEDFMRRIYRVPP